MRALIFILTLLISFQPVSWAASSCAASQGDDKGHAMSSFLTETALSTVHRSSENSNSSFSISAASHAMCINTMNTMTDNTAVECLVGCLADCTSSACLETPATALFASVSFDAYLVPSMHRYALFYGSPEIHPPRAKDLS